MNSSRTIVVIAILAGALALACGADDAPAASDARPAAASAAGTPTIEDGAVRVPQGYEPPKDRVASTGATVPVNGKPTLVFVDAIW